MIPKPDKDDFIDGLAFIIFVVVIVGCIGVMSFYTGIFK